jgi:hypothetical protein
MGLVREPAPVKLLFGLLGKPESLAAGREALAGQFGTPELTSGIFAFRHTDYYRLEMGDGLQRQFIVPKGVVNPGVLPEIKNATNELEDGLSSGDSRKVNIDPGYLNESRLVLATTKDYSHRLYLGDGIYGEITLSYRAGRFHPTEFTYPDYRSEEYLDFFEQVRESLRAYLDQANQVSRGKETP